VKFGFVFFLVLTGSVCFAQSSGPSLADVARQAREQKKKEKVFTDEDLPRRAASSATATMGAAAPRADNSGVPGEADSKRQPGSKAADSASKSNDSAATMKQSLSRYTQERDAWKASVQHYEDLLQNETDAFRRETYEAALSTDKQNVKVYQTKIDEIQGQIAAAEKAKSEGGSTGSQPAQDSSQGTAGNQ